MVLVLPGVADVNANFFWLQRALISDDFPELERPTIATAGIGGILPS